MRNKGNSSTKSPTLSIPMEWGELSWEQLVWIYSQGVRKSDESEIMWKWRVWLELAGVELFGESYLQSGMNDQTPFLDRDNLEVDDLRKMANYLSGAEYPLFHSKDGVDPTLICLLRTKEKQRWWSKLWSRWVKHKDLPMGAELITLYEAIKSQTKWLDTNAGLYTLPIENVWIGNVCYKVPDTLLTNLTYEQYNNCQHILQEYWGIISVISKDGDIDKDYAMELGNELISCQSNFIANILTKRKFQLFDTKDGVSIKMSYTWAYDSNDAEKTNKRLSKLKYIRVSRFSKKIPIYVLFGILYRQFHSGLEEYKKMYPNLFSTGGGKSNDHPLMIEIGTLNAVMKYGGFSKPDDVYNSNAVVIFKWLDTMSKEAKEMEKITKKANRSNGTRN